jgi:CRP-like cAMP-binding protein
MVMSWLGGSKELSLTELIAKKQYARALDILQAEFQKGDRSPRFRLQFADVLAMAGRSREALPILLNLADDFARDGFAAKAIAILKKAEKIQPGEAIERRLAGLIQEKQRTVTITASGSFTMPAFDVEEFHEAPPEPAAEPTAPAPAAADLELESEPAPIENAAAEDFDYDLGAELVSLIQNSFDDESTTQPAAPQPGVAIPLFGDFSQEELVAVIHGLRLLSFHPGDIVISQGERGDSMFVLTTGTVKAWVRDPDGKHVQVREMHEGDFFGEISILTGQPRTATVTCASRCELLVLDRRTLDDIKKRHPRVLSVLNDFYQQRINNPAEARIKQGQTK